jgi:thiol-disulfide isomerase/thioredoxin
MVAIDITLYKANWCGYCHKYIPMWEKITEFLKDPKIINILKKDTVNLVLDTIDIDDKSKKSDITKNNINSVPTVIITIKDDNNNSNNSNNKFNLKNTELNEQFIDDIFNFKKQYNQMADLLKNELNIFLDNETNKETNKETNNIKSGGFFDYSTNKRLKYHKEYIKCRNLYLKLKNK